ncbi:MAG: hypothetical protein Q8N47_09360 [Bryobacterales bacterium]|nr:hypothetical protein [Bryobacterales bacterium]
MHCVSTVTALVCLGATATPERDPRAGPPNADVRLGVVAATGGAARCPTSSGARRVIRACARCMIRPRERL